jgi:hypothetical protein
MGAMNRFLSREGCYESEAKGLGENYGSCCSIFGSSETIILKVEGQTVYARDGGRITTAMGVRFRHGIVFLSLLLEPLDIP